MYKNLLKKGINYEFGERHFTAHLFLNYFYLKKYYCYYFEAMLLITGEIHFHFNIRIKSPHIDSNYAVKENHIIT